MSATNYASSTAEDDPGNSITLLVGGMIYGNWTSITVGRGIDRLASDFSIGVSERWDGTGPTWQIQRGSPCVLKIGQDTALTGYVNDYEPEFDATTHRVTIRGRSKTQDLFDCTPDIKGGQFKGYTLEAIARSLCQLFGIGVVIQTPATQIFPDATLGRCETAFTFLERLGRLSGVLLTDDVDGNLVLTTAGNSRASGLLMQGQNILRGSAKFSDEKRFSTYIVKGQHAIGSAAPGWGGAGGIGSPTAAAPAAVVTNMKAVANDTGVMRYRPHVSIAEAQLDQAGMQRRANWERNYNFGCSVSADITVHGWRQPDGKLWAINQLVACTVPFLQIDQDLLVASVEFSIDDRGGRRTRMKVGPVEGYTPDPGQVKQHCKKGKKGKTAPDWNGAGIS